MDNDCPLSLKAADSYEQRSLHDPLSIDPSKRMPLPLPYSPQGIAFRLSFRSLPVTHLLRPPQAPFRTHPLCMPYSGFQLTNVHTLRTQRPPLKQQHGQPSVAMGQHRHHGGHSHSHHHHDNTYLTSTNKKDAGVRITRIGLYVNCLMAVGKAAGGYFLHSQALLADAAHSLADLVSDILTLATVSWSLRAPTDRFPAGYGKIESMGSLGVSGLLFMGGLGLCWSSCGTLFEMWFPTMDILGPPADHAGHTHGHGHDHGGSGWFGHSHSHNPADLGIPNMHAAWIAGGSILVKEYLYRASMDILQHPW